MKHRRHFHRPLQERPWIIGGASFLAAVAGFINATLVGFVGLPVSHMSGNSTRWAMDLARTNRADFVLVSSVVAGFLGGAFLSGLVVGGRRIRSGRHYGIVLMIESSVLLIAMVLLVHGRSEGVAFAAMACGLQNGMGSSYLGLDIRTSHVTGTVTDLAMMTAHWIRHRRVPGWKFGLLASILASFVAGGFLGMRAELRVGPAALAIPALLCGAAGAGYWLWRHSRRVRSLVRAMSPVSA